MTIALTLPSSNALASEVKISGFCHPSFQAVYDAFAANLASGQELGASVCAVVAGQIVVDLWGGYQDSDRSQPWQEDTIVCMMSTGKGMGALCVLLLVDRGLVELDEAIATYWPEFAQGGKEAITVRQMLAHQASLPFLDSAPTGSLFDTSGLYKAIEQQAPSWEPGQNPGYHTFTMGLLVGGLVTKVTGQSIDSFWREEIVAKFNIDYRFILSAEEQARCSDVYASDRQPFAQALRNTRTKIGRAWAPFPRADFGQIFNSSQFRTWGIPSIGHGNARALARIYGGLANGGKIEGKELISKELLEEAVKEHWHGVDAILNSPFRHGLGLVLSNPTYNLNGNPNCFGGPGAGGSIGLGDPDVKVGFGYAPNRMANAVDEGPCAKRLIEATFSCL